MKSLLKKKVNNWLESIDDDTIKRIIQNNLIITGGCITSMINNETINDFDCYFKTKSAVLKVAEYYINKWNQNHRNANNKIGNQYNIMLLDCDNPSDEIKEYYNVENLKNSKAIMISNFDKGRVKIIIPSDGIVGDVNGRNAINANDELGEDVEELLEDLNISSNPIDNIIDTISEMDDIPEKEITKLVEKYSPVFFSTNAITLSDKIQLIVRFYGTPADIHETYDFIHTKAYYNYKENYLSIPKEVYEHTINKTLKYTGSRYPLCSLFRMRKFISRGWKINVGQIVKMCMQLNDLNLKDINVLEDQLIGVDSVYFMNLIRQFRDQKSNNINFNIDTDYVISIIDKIFG